MSDTSGPQTSPQTDAGVTNDEGSSEGFTSTGTTSADDTESQATQGETSTGLGDETSGSSGSGSSESTSSPAASCDDIYGGAPGYVLCLETTEECHFAATTNGGTCSEMCAMFGGTCLAAFDIPNTPGQECRVIRPNMDDCETMRFYELCACSK